MDDKHLKTMMEEVANSAASTAAQIVKEEMQSQFKVFGEKLDSIDGKVTNIDKRLEKIETQVSVHELAIKKAF